MEHMGGFLIGTFMGIVLGTILTGSSAKGLVAKDIYTTCLEQQLTIEQCKKITGRE